jgi:hypothetical protein
MNVGVVVLFEVDLLGATLGAYIKLGKDICFKLQLVNDCIQY